MTLLATALPGAVLPAVKNYMLITILHFDCLRQLRTSFSLIPNIYYLEVSFSDQRIPLLYLFLHSQYPNSLSIKPKAFQSLYNTFLHSVLDLQKIKLVCFTHLLE